MRRVILVVIIGLIALAATNQRAIPAKKLFSYPVGSTPELISDVPCGVALMGCRAGFGAFGPNGELYFFDNYNNNIKVLDLENGTLLELIDGPEILEFEWKVNRKHSGVQPYDMTVNPDGIPILLIEDGSGCGFYRIFQKRSGELGWDEIAAPSMLGLGIYSSNCCIIDTAPDGEIYLYSREKHKSFSVTELQSPALKERISAAPEHTRMMNEKFPTGTSLLLHPTREYREQMSLVWDEARPGRVGWDGRFYSTRAIPHTEKNTGRVVRVKARGSLVGVSKNGTVITSSGGEVQAVDVAGQIIAVGIKSRAPSEKMFSGHFGTLVSPEGRTIQFRLTKTDFEIYLLMGGE